MEVIPQNASDGFQAVSNEVASVKKHKLIYTILAVSDINTVSLTVIKSLENPHSGDLRYILDENTLILYLESLKSQLDAQKSYFIVYNFGFYTNNNEFRQKMIMISYIPESEKAKIKFAMAFNFRKLSDAFEIQINIEAQSISDLTYHNIKSACQTAR